MWDCIGVHIYNCSCKLDREANFLTKLLVKMWEWTCSCKMDREANTFTELWV